MCGVVCAESQVAAEHSALVAGLTRLRVAKALAAGDRPDLAAFADPACTEEERAQVGQLYAGGGFLGGDAERVAAGLRELAAGTGATDTVDKRVLLIGTDLVRAVCLATVAAMAIAGWYRTDAMIVLTALNMAAFAVTGPSQYSALRTVVTETELAEATALMQGRSYAVDLFAPTVGGFLFALSRALPFAADAASFLFSAGCTARIRATLAPPPGTERVRFRVSFARGWQLLWQHRLLRYSTLFSTTTNLVVSVLVYAVLLGSGGSGAAASGLGLTVTLAGLAGMLGAAAGPFAQRRLLLSQVLTGSCLVRTLAVLPAVMLDDPVVRSLAMIVVVFTSPVAGAAMSTARMLAIPRELLGTVSGASGLLATCAQPLAPLAAGLLIETVGNRIQFGILGGCFLLMAMAVAVPASLRVSAAR
ncbi:MAG TPA: MFS transporter [Jatrophihabitans sp.]|nr:MFS transporter [Jatrophihabitans sp.]